MAYFTALSIPPEITALLKTIRPALTDATWMHPDDYHLTLAYLGEPSSDICNLFWQNISKRIHPSQTIQLKQLHVFRNVTGCVLVLLADVMVELEALHVDHVQTARLAGIDVHTFPAFMPHVTLASFPVQVLNMEDLALQSLPAWTAGEVTLYKSNKPHGTGVGRYEALESYLLKTT